LDLLRALAAEAWIPAAVWREAVINGAGRPEAALIARDFSCMPEAPAVELEAAFRLQVDAGEAAALAVAHYDVRKVNRRMLEFMGLDTEPRT